jgi:hypothetical protein
MITKAIRRICIISTFTAPPFLSFLLVVHAPQLSAHSKTKYYNTAIGATAKYYVC